MPRPATTSIRLLGLESRLEFAGILEHLRHTDTVPSYSPKAAASDESGSHTVATLTFGSDFSRHHVHDLKRFITSRHPGVHIDENFLGITVLSSPMSNGAPPVDIVAVHGLQGHAANTWTHLGFESSPCLWIRDLIPERLPGARVMTFGYDASLQSKRTGGIADAAKNLLHGLAHVRGRGRAGERPIIFIAHSLGGLVVKAALALSASPNMYGSIHSETCGIAFFGTPHCGSKTADLGKFLANVASVCWPIADHNLKLLRKDCEALLDLNERFVSVLEEHRIQIFSLHELLKTNTLLFRSIMVVPRKSAVLQLPHEVVIPVEADHRGMCRFPNKHCQAYKTLMDRIEEVLKRRLDNTEQIVFPAYPPDDPYFVGRGDILKEAQAYLSDHASNVDQTPPCVALIGMPGMGKTSLAKRIIRETKCSYDYILFLSAESEPKLLQDFKGICRLLELGGTLDTESGQAICGIVINHLTKTDRRWLLVFDNAEEPGVLAPRWPHKGNGCVIVTSRNRNICQGIQANTRYLQLHGLGVDHGEDFLFSRLGSELISKEQSRRFCNKLAAHFISWPLVLRQLSAFMNESKTDPQKMWELLEKTADADNAIFSWVDRDEVYQHRTLIQAWKTILCSLRRDSGRLLSLLSLLDPDKISNRFFSTGGFSNGKGSNFWRVSSSESNPTFVRHTGIDNGNSYRAAKATLLNYDIVSESKQSLEVEASMSIHRVVQSARLEMLGRDERQEAFDAMLAILATAFPKQVLGSHMHEFWEECEASLAHVLAFDKAVQKWKPSLGQRSAIYVNLMCDVTWYLWEVDQHNEALRLLESTEAICGQTIGLDTLEGARIFVNRGSVLSKLNQYHEAGDLFEKALTIRKRLLPESHQLLANSYMQMGNYYLNTSSGAAGIEKAIQAHQKVIESRLGSAATKPADMIVSYYNLCRSLVMGGRLNDAEENLAKAQLLEGELRGGPQTSLYYKSCRLFILGNIHARRRDFGMALDAHREAYKIRLSFKKPYSEGMSLHKIGTLEYELGRRDQAMYVFYLCSSQQILHHSALLIMKHSGLLKEAIQRLESSLGPKEAKLKWLARTEMALAEILGANREAAGWREQAMRHYCEAVGGGVADRDWSQIDFDALVPVIDR
ncbi:hypothetical protein OQA88_7713 [Cercophora sp. LCS_1]